MAKQKELMPSAELESRYDDVELTPEQLGKLSLFAGLKGKTDLEKFPGTLRLRHYNSGDAICRCAGCIFTGRIFSNSLSPHCPAPTSAAGSAGSTSYRSRRSGCRIRLGR